MSFVKFFAPFGLVVFVAGSATAQSSGQRITIESSSPRQEGLVRIQTAVSFFLPGPTGEGEEAERLRDRARRIVYGMAGQECDVAREVFAKDCRLEALNNNISSNRQHSAQQPDGLTVNASMTMQVTLK